jgi:branched-chain amino acid transport system permease protein
MVAQSYLQDVLRVAHDAATQSPLAHDLSYLVALLSPDRWLLWLGLLFVLAVYHFPTGITGRLRRS